MLKMFVWHVQPNFLAVAQASSVKEARELLLGNGCIGESGDGSCPERDKARQFVLETNPTIWMGPNAEFVLTDSAELREQENYSRTLFARLADAEKALEEIRTTAMEGFIQDCSCYGCITRLYLKQIIDKHLTNLGVRA